MAKPKLALIPAAQGDKFYSVLPSDGVGDFDFTRNSSATRIAPTGFIEEVGAFGSDLFSGYDFTNWEAIASTPTVSNSYVFVNVNDWIRKDFNATASKNYLITIEGTQTGNLNINSYSGIGIGIPTITSSSFSETFVVNYGANDAIMLQSPTANNTVTITTFTSVEIVGNKSRLNYDLLNGKVVNCPHYLLEPQRTNVLLQSNQFDTSWVVANSTVTSNSGVSPSGDNNAWKIQSTAVNSETRVRQSKTFTIGQSITVSCFMKAGNVNYGIVRCWAINAGGRAWFNLSNGIIETVDGGVTAKIEKYPNGWYRCIISGTVTVASAAVDIAPSQADNEYLSGAVGENILIYGAQLEEASYPTSYIPTNGTAITRAAESANGSGNAATFNDSEGVLMLEVSALANDGTYRLNQINDNSINNMITLGYNNASNQILVQIRSNAGTTQSLNHTVTDILLYNKLSLKYKLNDVSLWINGFEVETLSSAIMPIGLSNFGLDYNFGFPFYGKTKQIQYFDSALTDAQLETLTSWTSLQEMITSQLYTNY